MSGTASAIVSKPADPTNELLNALASVHSLSEILRDHPGIDSRQKQHFIDIILTETKRVAMVVADLPQLPISA